MTDPTSETRAHPQARRPARRSHAAGRARLIVGALAVGAGLTMVGAMAATAQSDQIRVGATDDAVQVVVLRDGERPPPAPAAAQPQASTRGS